MSLKNNKTQDFLILCPPPNVTGSLHIGHAFTFSIQDYIVRLQRNFLNKNAYLLPGFDHGGLSTETSAGKNSVLSDNRVEKFQQIKEFAENAKKNIKHQFEKLNLLMNFNYEKYTFEDFHVKLVEETFVKLYNKGLITKNLGVVNYDTKLKTAISDLEVEYKNIKSKIYTITYKTDLNEDLAIATTRPETIFADMAVAVNPNDERYKHLIGKNAIIPIINKQIPIIADEYVSIDFGTGVLKITPAHAINDYKLWQKHLTHLDIVNIIDTDGNLKLDHIIQENESHELLEKMHKQSVQKAREIIVNYLNLASEDLNQSMPFSSKSNVEVEYLLTQQWFLNVKKAAEIASQNISKINIYPNIWFNNYKSWLDNIYPNWCISRSLVWGHSMPVWYNNKGEHKVQIEKPEGEWNRTAETLDTWFSSALWPISYKKQFGKDITDVLVTAYDIIFFWVARMVMMNIMLDEDIPFKNIYLHRLVTDSEGQKMSKTKGNVINPLEIIDEYGVDVLRLALLKTLSPCGKISISPQSLSDAKNILTKMRNFQKYLQLDFNDEPLDSEDKLILQHFQYEFYDMEQRFKIYLENYDLHLIINESIEKLYDLCSWMLEFSKLKNSLIIELKKYYNKIKAFIGAIAPEEFDYQEEYEYSEKCEKINDIDDLMYVINQLRGYNKLGINVQLDNDSKFKDIICRMAYCQIGSVGKPIEIRGFNVYLSDIKIQTINDKIDQNTFEIEQIQQFLNKTNEKTPEKIILEKNHIMKNLFMEINNLKRLL